MTRARMLFSGLFAALSLSAAPVFAAPALGIQAKAKLELKGYQAPTYEEKRETRARYEEKLELKVLELVNQARARKGLPELSADKRGTRSARAAALEAMREGSFRDLRSSVETRLEDQGVNASYEMVELTRLIKGSDRDLDAMARKIVKAWLKDPRQARLLLDADLSYAGVGVVSLNGKFAVALDAFGPKPVPLPRPQPKPVPHC